MGDPGDEVWRTMTSLLHSNRETWSRRVIDRTAYDSVDPPILSRLDGVPLTVKALASAATVDAPAPRWPRPSWNSGA